MASSRPPCPPPAAPPPLSPPLTPPLPGAPSHPTRAPRPRVNAPCALQTPQLPAVSDPDALNPGAARLGSARTPSRRARLQVPAPSAGSPPPGLPQCPGPNRRRRPALSSSPRSPRGPPLLGGNAWLLLASGKNLLDDEPTSRGEAPLGSSPNKGEDVGWIHCPRPAPNNWVLTAPSLVDFRASADELR